MNRLLANFCLHNKSSQRGFTLVELMIAMTIGAFISAGVIALFIGNNQGYRTNEAMARVQENGRFAIEYLARDVRQAGVTNLSTVLTIWPPVDYIQGWQGASSKPDLTTSPAPSFGSSWNSLGNYTKNTDVLGIRFYDATAATPAVVNHVYYIAPNSDTNRPGLYQKVGSLSANELLENVYDMQVRYGVDNTRDGQIDNYVSANSVSDSDWNYVFAVKFDLLFGSVENNLAETPMSLPFEKNDGTFFTATDRRLYKMFSTTIALRNRMK
jgi:type IV pilus assembly protein PilW